jgi:hypothetical protein
VPLSAAVTYIYTSEVFPTSVRSTGFGFVASFARFGERGPSGACLHLRSVASAVAPLAAVCSAVWMAGSALGSPLRMECWRLSCLFNSWKNVS